MSHNHGGKTINTKSKRYQIAFLISGDPNDEKYSWSGTWHYMAKALQKYCGDVFPIGSIQPISAFAGKVANKLAADLRGNKFDFMHREFFAKRFARYTARKLKQREYDFIFAPAASSEIAFLDTNLPIVYTSDATFALVTDYYDWFTDLLPSTIMQGNAIEKRAIMKARIVFYATEWAANSAVHDYGAPADKVFVAPHGADLDAFPDKADILKKKKSDTCRLFFLGVDWQRKGGDLAVETLAKLKTLGVKAKLTICGCTPPYTIDEDDVEIIPFLDKGKKPDRDRLENLFLYSDFLLLPTKAECYGIVFCEANAFGLPVISRDTGGVSSVIKNDENGFVLPADAGARDYADLIKSVYKDDEKYYDLVISSRSAFETRLNWDAWGKKVAKLIHTKCFNSIG